MLNLRSVRLFYRINLNIPNNYTNKMKGTNFFRTLALAAFVVFSLGGVLVSCDKFDDTELKESISDLEDRVTALEEAVAQLQGDVTAIESLLEEGKVIKSVTDNGDGTYTIAYVDSEETDVITVGTGNPVITVIDEDGVYYWAKVNENGEAEHLLGADNKLPVSEQPGTLKFKVDEGALLVSTDGGATWTDAGVTLSEDYDFATFKSVTYDGDYVVFTLQDGTEIRVLRSDELTCDILSGKVMFQYGETKSVSVDAGGYIVSEVTAPEGWTVKFNGVTLEVTAPSESAADFEMGGDVVLKVYSKDQLMVDKVSVQIGYQALTVSTEVKDGVTNIVVSTEYANSFFCGVTKLSEFSAEAAAEAASGELYTEVGQGQYRWETTADADGNIVPFTRAFTDFVASPEPGEVYVVWTLEFPQDYVCNPDDVQTYMFTYGQSVEVKIENVTFNDADITITPAGGTSYYWGLYMGGFYFDKSMIAYAISDGQYWTTTESYSSTFSEMNSSSSTPLSIKHNQDYVLWIVYESPIPGTEYTADDVMVYEFKTADYTYDGTAAVSFTGETEVTSTEIRAMYDYPENTYEVYSTILDSRDWQSMGVGDEEAFKRMMIDGGAADMVSVTAFQDGSSEPSCFASGLTPNTTYYFYVVVVDNEGKVGPLTIEEVKTEGVTTNPDISLAAGTATIGTDSYTLPLTFTGGPAKLIYYHVRKSEFDEDYLYKGDVEKVKDAMSLDPDGWKWTSVSVAGQTSYSLALTDLMWDEDYVLVATVVGNDGRTSSDFVVMNYTTATPNTVVAGTAEWEAVKPTVSAVTYTTDDLGDVTAKMTVTPGADVATWYYTYGDAGYYDTSDMTALMKTVMGGRAYEGSQDINVFMFSKDVDAEVFIAWIDSDGNYYQPMKVTVKYPAE